MAKNYFPYESSLNYWFPCVLATLEKIKISYSICGDMSLIFPGMKTTSIILKLCSMIKRIHLWLNWNNTILALNKIIFNIRISSVMPFHNYTHSWFKANPLNSIMSFACGKRTKLQIYIKTIIQINVLIQIEHIQKMLLLLLLITTYKC